MKPYVQGAGPIPNDEYGDGHMQVSPQFSRRTNTNILNQHSTDGNIGMYEQGYGTPGQPADLYGGAQHGLTEEDHQKVSAQGGSLAQAMHNFTQMFGEETGAQVLDEIMRVAASEDANGPMAQPDTSRMPLPQLPSRGGKSGRSQMPGSLSLPKLK